MIILTSLAPQCYTAGDVGQGATAVLIVALAMLVFRVTNLPIAGVAFSVMAVLIARLWYFLDIEFAVLLGCTLVLVFSIVGLTRVLRESPGDAYWRRRSEQDAKEEDETRL